MARRSKRDRSNHNKPQQRPAPPPLAPLTNATAAAPTQDNLQHVTSNAPESDAEPPQERIFIRIPGKYHPRRATQSQPRTRDLTPQDDHEEPVPAQLHGDETDDVPHMSGASTSFQRVQRAPAWYVMREEEAHY